MWCAPLFHLSKTPKHGYAVTEHTCLSSNNCLTNMQFWSASHSRDNMKKCLMFDFYFFLFWVIQTFLYMYYHKHLWNTEHMWRVGSHPTARQWKCFNVHVGPVNMVPRWRNEIVFLAWRKLLVIPIFVLAVTFLNFLKRRTQLEF